MEQLDKDYQTIINIYTIEDIIDDYDEYDDITAQCTENPICTIEHTNLIAVSEEEILREQYADTEINNLRLRL